MTLIKFSINFLFRNDNHVQIIIFFLHAKSSMFSPKQIYIQNDISGLH